MPRGTDSALSAPAASPAAPLAGAEARALRDDIQWLRGLSVLAVLFYHADKDFLPGGYLGVDVFFVLSGFLITRNIFPAIERGAFSYAGFIARRFRRLLPACYAMLAFSAALGALLLTRADLLELLRQMAGTLSFSANVVLWQQAGYFDTASALKPLLHTWSLSLEEQYYLVLPPLLYLGLRGRRADPLKLLAALCLGSLLACLAAVHFKPEAAFFLLPFRAWELLAGSICAVLSLQGRAPAVPAPARWLALGVLIATLAYPPAAPHPGAAALIVVLATSLLMLGALDFGTRAPARAMYFLGDISYSLYLFHWPLFAVANHVFAEKVPLAASVFLMLVALILAALSYRFVEQPFRAVQGVPRRRVFLLAGAGAVALLLAASAAPVLRPAPDRDPTGRAPNYGLGRACAADDAFALRPECQSSPAPSVLLWGDSYAMHLAQALSSDPRFGFLQATKSLCGPLPGIAPPGGAYGDGWAAKCLAFNDSVLRFLDDHPEIRVVVLGSKWRQYFEPEGDGAFAVRDASGTVSREAAVLAPETVEAAVRALVSRIGAGGRKVVLVLPPPSADFDVRRCVERRREDLPYIGAPADCRIDRAAWTGRDAALTRALTAAGEAAGAALFSFEPLLCADAECMTELDGVPLYQDAGHFSPRGSAVAGARSGLRGRVAAALADAAKRTPEGRP